MSLTYLKLALAALVLRTATAQTPPGLVPATSKHLTVTYGTSAINPAGITSSIAATAQPPSLGLSGSNSGTYVAIMLDLSVETSSTTPNTTLLHWIVPGLASPAGTSTLSSHEGVIASYFPPGPPAGQTHTYVILLYNEPTRFSVPADYIPFFSNLTASVFNRVGFNLTKFVDETELGAPVAADWFLVGNAAAVSSTAGSSTSTSVPSTISSTSPPATTTVALTMVTTASGTTSSRASTSPTASILPSISSAATGWRVDPWVLAALGAVGMDKNERIVY